jgi:hypothetical protein
VGKPMPFRLLHALTAQCLDEQHLRSSQPVIQRNPLSNDNQFLFTTCTSSASPGANQDTIEKTSELLL